jgi:ABC-type nitrate/sulfonate/bicarbonate transport system ATPase subunit
MAFCRDEAIFLSDRIYLLSKRPAVVKEIFDVNIKKPRGSSTLTSKEFIGIKGKILNIL